ncbi:hypothetical protein CC79DRAFT_193845 [Sarocladium strictum]
MAHALVAILSMVFPVMDRLLRIICDLLRFRLSSRQTDGADQADATAVSHLLHLPPDLVLPIASYLESEDAAALSLSCKALWAIQHGPQLSMTLSGTQKKKLLLRLRRDLGKSHFFCSYCAKLHRTSYLPLCTTYRPFDGSSYVGIAYRLGIISFWFAYYHGRSIINRHFHGLDSRLLFKSLNVKLINHYAHFKLPRKDPVWNVHLQAKIVRDELVVRAEHTLERAGDLSGLWTEVERQCHYLCRHSTTEGTNLRRICHIVMGYDVLAFGSMSCGLCATDWTIQVAKVSQFQPKHIIKVNSYHLLGGLGNHYEWKWQGGLSLSFMPGKAPRVEDRARNWTQIPWGSLVKVWNEGGITKQYRPNLMYPEMTRNRM